jgi:type IV pilus assembly protein PilF
LLEAHSLAPQDPLVLAGEGFYAVHMQEWSIAKNFYQAALDAAPNRPDIQDDYGAFLYQAKQYKAALPYFLEAAANQNNLYAKEAFQNAGLTELKLGHAAAARADFISARLSE